MLHNMGVDSVRDVMVQFVAEGKIIGSGVVI